MYMPGRLRTASSPSRTVMSFAPYEPFFAFGAVFLAAAFFAAGFLVDAFLVAPDPPEARFLEALPRAAVFATQLPFSSFTGNPDLISGAESPGGHGSRGSFQVHISLPVGARGTSVDDTQKPCKSRIKIRPPDRLRW